MKKFTLSGELFLAELLLAQLPPHIVVMLMKTSREQVQSMIRESNELMMSIPGASEMMNMVQGLPATTQPTDEQLSHIEKIRSQYLVELFSKYNERYLGVEFGEEVGNVQIFNLIEHHVKSEGLLETVPEVQYILDFLPGNNSSTNQSDKDVGGYN